MSYAYSRSDSGLVLARAGMDETAVRRALTDHDSDLRLIPPGVMLDGQPNAERVGYRVARYRGGDRPLEFLCFWGNDHGDPYPLSHGLVELVQSLDRGGRGGYKTAEQRNLEAREQQQRRYDETSEALISDHLTVAGRGHAGALHRGQHLRRARDKRRARGENV